MDKLSIAMLAETSPLLKRLMEEAKLTEWETIIFYYIMFEELKPIQMQTRGLVPYDVSHIYKIYRKARHKINKILP